MWKFKIIIFGYITFAILGCTQKVEFKKNRYFDLPAYFKAEVDNNVKSHFVLEKTIESGDDIHSDTLQNPDWKSELHRFLEVDLNKQGGFELTLDSSGPLAITRYSAIDSTLEVQELDITRRNGVIELLVIETRVNSFLLNRSERLSYQPGKGFGLRITEDYIWSRPSYYEIFAQIINTPNLNR
jgi:hypothetical protein